MLGGPDVVESAAVGQLDFVQRVLEQSVLGFLRPRPGKLMFVKPAKLHSYEFNSRSLAVAVQCLTIERFLDASLFRKSTAALADRKVLRGSESMISLSRCACRSVNEPRVRVTDALFI